MHFVVQFEQPPVSMKTYGMDDVKAASSRGAYAEFKAGQTVQVRVGRRIGTVPPLGVGLAPEDAGSALKSTKLLAKLKPAYVICHYDTRLGHDRKSLTAMLKVAAALKAEAWLEAVVTKVEGFEDEIASLAKIVSRLKDPFVRVFLSPAPDMKSTQPTGPWPRSRSARPPVAHQAVSVSDASSRKVLARWIAIHA